jgi:hypothetical protein
MCCFLVRHSFALIVQGRGGISLVARASGVSRRAIRQGLTELKQKPELAGQAAGGRVRKQGGGRKKTRGRKILR